MSNLFEPIKVGRYTAKNRIFMAPMSRYRSPERGIVPDFTAEYYSQRADAGLIIANPHGSMIGRAVLTARASLRQSKPPHGNP